MAMAANAGFGEIVALPMASSADHNSTTKRPTVSYKIVSPSYPSHLSSLNQIRSPSPHPDTPTPAGPLSNGTRTRNWAAAALKGVKSVEVLRAKKSSNTLKKSPGKRRRSVNELGVKSRVLSRAIDKPRSISSGAAYQYKRSSSPPPPTPQVNKALPSEKPLPRMPDIKLDIESSPATSRSLIDAEERPLHRSPPGMPGVKEDWPILSPVKATAAENNETIESQLTPMAPRQPEEIHSGVKLFADAASRLANTFGADPPTGRRSSLNEELADPTNATMEAQAESRMTEPGNANLQSANPFRNKSRPSTLSRSPPATPVNRNFSYTFDSQRRNAMYGLHEPLKGDSMEATLGKEPAIQGPSPPDTRSSISKIPRISPVVSPTTSTFPSGLAHRPMSPVLSPSHRSSIPIPKRFIQSYRADQAPVTPVYRKDLMMPESAQAKLFTPDSPSSLPESNRLAQNEQSQQSLEPSGVSNNDEPDYHSPVGPKDEYLIADTVRVKQLSEASPSVGPQLRISPEAEQVIMGNAPEQSNEIKRLSAQARWRIENRREFRLSSDSLFGGFGMKRDRNSRPRSSLGNASISQPTVKEATVKKIPKVNSADLTIHSQSPSSNDQGIKKLLNLEPGQSAGKTSNNPFFNKVMSKSPSFRAKEGKGSQNATKGESELIVETSTQEAAPTSGGPSGNQDPQDFNYKVSKNAEVSPPKIKRSPERADSRRNLNVKKRESPRTQRIKNPAHRTPDKSSRRHSNDHANQSRSRINRVMPPLADLQENTVQEQIGREMAPHTRRSHSHLPQIPPEDTTKSKPSVSKGVLSNFRGLFTKHKADITKENAPHAHPHSHSKERLSRKSRSSLNGGRSITRSPVRYYQAIFGTDREGQSSQEPQTLSISVPTHLPSTQVAPAFADTRDVSGLAMEVLDSARVESDPKKKEQLVKLGSFLIEAVNHSNDAEKAMITAIQAAKQAEISCALAKENSLRIGQVAREWMEINLNNMRG